MAVSIDYKNLGSRLSIARKQKGVTLKETAAAVDVAASTIQRYEKGQFSKVKMPVIEALADYFEVSPEWLIGITDDPYDYEKDTGSLLSEIPDARRHEWQKQGLSVQEMVARQNAIEEDERLGDQGPIYVPAITDDQIKAAFFNGADPTLTKEEQDAMWDEAKAFIDFKIQQRKQKENQ